MCDLLHVFTCRSLLMAISSSFFYSFILELSYVCSYLRTIFIFPSGRWCNEFPRTDILDKTVRYCLWYFHERCVIFSDLCYVSVFCYIFICPVFHLYCFVLFVLFYPVIFHLLDLCCVYLLFFNSFILAYFCFSFFCPF